MTILILSVGFVSIIGLAAYTVFLSLDYIATKDKQTQNK
jgi:hypothetical protein